jgi:TPR repeat protein
MVIITPQKLREYWYWIGYCYEHGTGGVAVDYWDSERFWRRALRDLENDEDVQDNTGKIRFALVFNGVEIIFDPDFHTQTIPRLQWEAAQGDSQSQYYLGVFFGYPGHLATNLNPHYDYIQSAYWFERSAKQIPSTL